ncbi:hypothetical protein AAVH_41681 [Aphelenchoides avenae]|nr:hypothetical protein AAVH_41681 [Aphelenchus avenae]
MYTTDVTERNALINNGFVDEGITGCVFSSSGPDGFVPFYRLYHPVTHDHLMTTSNTERVNAEKLGFKYERTVGYIARRISNGASPHFNILCRLYSEQAKDHLYTADPEERRVALTNGGYKDEGVAGWMYFKNTC